MEFVLKYDGHIHGLSDLASHIYLEGELWHWVVLDYDGKTNAQDRNSVKSLQKALDECYENATGKSCLNKPSWSLTLPSNNQLFRNEVLIEDQLVNLGYVASIQGLANLVMTLGPKTTKADAKAAIMAELTAEECHLLTDLRLDLNGLQSWMAELPFPLYGYVKPGTSERSASLILSQGALKLMKSAMCLPPTEAPWKTQMPSHVRDAIETSGGVVVPLFANKLKL